MKFCKWKQLDSLIGLLHDASIVVRPGRTFIGHLIDVLKSSKHIDALKSSNHRCDNVFIRLNNLMSCGGIASLSSGMVCR